uniref:Heme exporter protein C n=1 Tax=Candidatus Kentrum sp. SD TaxID=2126332 RepID=A0A450YWK9_9GAMM|nr:MAG: heme exporter protein C [Candidatus Kentron sp. SD]VFK45920.1 MAG: heme exporter protein C [Candidatus Kentron sp. SD]VFK79852.1 MAG: heme exporter protein C [Candidatus Kentron sp. SD]
MWQYLHKLSSPSHFYRFAGSLAHWFGWVSLAFMLGGLYGGLVMAPPDYQQGDAFRIIYVHVPAAIMSLFVYIFMAGVGVIGLLRRGTIADALVAGSAPVGASFTFIALVTGSIWGKPMWGAWWVWDARLTSELVLLFLYLGVIGLLAAHDDRRKGARAAAWLAIVGVVNVPIVKFSVDWWNTLHQGSTLFRAEPSIHDTMGTPLLLMIAGFVCFFIATLLWRARCELLERERNRPWVEGLFGGGEDVLGEGDA